MAEHAADLVKLIPYLIAGAWTLIVALIGGVLWFVKRDRAMIDKDLIEMQAHICAKIDAVKTIAEQARSKAEALEKNYLARFDKVHDHLNSMQFEIQAALSDIKVSVAEKYMTKDEIRREIDDQVSRHHDTNK